MRPDFDAMRRLPNRSGAPPEAGEVAWDTYLKRRVSNHDMLCRSRKKISYKYHAKKSIASFRTLPLLTSKVGYQWICPA